MNDAYYRGGWGLPKAERRHKVEGEREILLHNSLGHHITSSLFIHPWTGIFVKMPDGPICVENSQA